MPDPFVIHRSGAVSDRETGEVVGKVWLSPWIGWACGDLGDKYIYAGTDADSTRRDAARLLWERWRERKGGRNGA